eukprot:1182727-Prorocentrum_minimum.AAC.4
MSKKRPAPLAKPIAKKNPKKCIKYILLNILVVLELVYSYIYAPFAFPHLLPRDGEEQAGPARPAVGRQRVRASDQQRKRLPVRLEHPARLAARHRLLVDVDAHVVEARDGEIVRPCVRAVAVVKPLPLVQRPNLDDELLPPGGPLVEVAVIRHNLERLADARLPQEDGLVRRYGALLGREGKLAPVHHRVHHHRGVAGGDARDHHQRVRVHAHRSLGDAVIDHRHELGSGALHRHDPLARERHRVEADVAQHRIVVRGGQQAAARAYVRQHHREEVPVVALRVAVAVERRDEEARVLPRGGTLQRERVAEHHALRGLRLARRVRQAQDAKGGDAGRADVPAALRARHRAGADGLLHHHLPGLRHLRFASRGGGQFTNEAGQFTSGEGRFTTAN